MSGKSSYLPVGEDYPRALNGGHLIDLLRRAAESRPAVPGDMFSHLENPQMRALHSTASSRAEAHHGLALIQPEGFGRCLRLKMQTICKYPRVSLRSVV